MGQWRVKSDYDRKKARLITGIDGLFDFGLKNEANAIN
jgi:hypothetical protein